MDELTLKKKMTDRGLSLIYADSVEEKAMIFERALHIVLPPKNRSDKTCFRNIARWLMAGCDTGTFNENVVFWLVLDFALEASGPKSRNPAAVFMSILKKELRYRPVSFS